MRVLFGHNKGQMGHLLVGHGAGSVTYPAGLSGAPDYYVDATNGSDSNDGSEAAPWATLSKIAAGLLSNGETVRVLVRADTYDTADDYIDIAFSSLTTASLEVGFEAGCTIDGTNYVNRDAITSSGTPGVYTNSFKVFGNGVTIQNVNTPTGNAIGGNNGGTCYFYDITGVDCVDGASLHGDMRAEFHRCNMSGMSKAPVAHIGTTQTAHYKCTFTAEVGATSGIGGLADSATATFDDCVFIPATSGQNLDLRNSTLTRCQIGTLSLRANIGAPSLATLSKCFINASHDANQRVTLDKCFGKYSVRTRTGGAVTATNCVFSGPASGLTNIVYSNFDPGGASKIIMNDCIIKGAFTFMSVDATNAGYMVSAACEFFNNILYPSLVYDADLVSADSGGTVIVGTITDDPLIGAANTLLMADYAFGDGSPAINAATDGGDIGFSAADVVERQTA